MDEGIAVKKDVSHQILDVLFLKLFKKFLIFIQFLKVTFHLQLLQNIGSIPRVVQYILEPTLHPTVYTSHSPPPILPFPGCTFVKETMGLADGWDIEDTAKNTIKMTPRWWT